MGAGHDCLPAGEPFGGSGLVEGGCLGVQLHIHRVDARPEDPGVVEVALAGFDEEDGEVVVQVGQSKESLAPSGQEEVEMWSSGGFSPLTVQRRHSPYSHRHRR